MHANVTQAGGAGGGSWRLPPDETLQVGDSKQEKDDVRIIYNKIKRKYMNDNRKCSYPIFSLSFNPSISLK